LSWRYQLNHWLWNSLDWLFPPLCGGCDRAGYRWCPDCQEQATRIPEPVCEICGLTLARAGLCRTCKKSRPGFNVLRSCFVFEDLVRKALHKLNYRRNVAVSEALSLELQARLAAQGWLVDLVVPAPLGRKRLLERGYNQVALMARPLALGCGLADATRPLARRRETRSQVGLSVPERMENVSGAFKPTPNGQEEKRYRWPTTLLRLMRPFQLVARPC